MCADPAYFPPGVLAARPDLETLCVAWYTLFLRAMDEGPLYPPPVDGPPTYRLLHLPTFTAPSVVRLVKVSEGWQVTGKRTNGQGGHSPGQLVSDCGRKLTATEVKRLEKLVSQPVFWEMASAEGRSGCDGTRCVLEGVRTGRYHVVDRWSPRRTAFADLVAFLLRLPRFSVDELGQPPRFFGSFAELEQQSRSKHPKGGPAE
jgi:hypothetical protein